MCAARAIKAFEVSNNKSKQNVSPYIMVHSTVAQPNFTAFSVYVITAVATMQIVVVTV